MTRTISLITATIGSALLFAVPANADNWGADKAQPLTDNQSVRVSPDLADRVIAAEQKRLSAMLDAREQSLQAGIGNGKVSAIEARERSLDTKQVVTASDWFERAAETAIRDNRVPVVDDRFTIDPTSGSPVTVSSGREVELPRIGIGLGIGLALALRADALHARPPARALIWVVETRWRPRPPRGSFERSQRSQGGLGVRMGNVAAVASEPLPYRKSLWRRALNAFVRPLARLGLAGPHTHLLTVRGRVSGKPWSTPVSIVRDGEERWLVAPYGTVGWVRNVR